MAELLGRHHRRQRSRTDLREAASMYSLRSWQWWRLASCPASFPITSRGRSRPRADAGMRASSPKIATWRDSKLEATVLLPTSPKQAGLAERAPPADNNRLRSPKPHLAAHGEPV